MLNEEGSFVVNTDQQVTSPIRVSDQTSSGKVNPAVHVKNVDS
jgi:hypothetical protein